MTQSFQNCSKCNSVQFKESNFCANCGNSFTKNYPDLETILQDENKVKIFFRKYNFLIIGIIIGGVLVGATTAFYLRYEQDMQKLNNSLSELDNRITDLNTKIDNLESSETNGNVEDITSKLDEIDGKVDDADTKLKHIRDDIGDIQSDVSSIQTKIGY